MYREKRREKILMQLMMFTVMISSMSALMFNIVLPLISQEFRLSLAEVSWMSSAYTIIYALGTVTFGKLADRFQLRTLLTFGLTLVAVGSLMGLLSESFMEALLGRCVQSAGASAIPALALIIPVRYFPPEERGSAISMATVGVALGTALAPVISALIVSVTNWRWLFMPSVLMLILLPFYLIHLDKEPKQQDRKFDWMGGCLLGVFVLLVLFGVTDQNWWYLLAGLPTFVLLVLRIRYAREPFIRIQLFQNKHYPVWLVLAFLIAGIGNSLYFLTPFLLTYVHHLGSGWIGFAMVPAAVVSSILGRQGGKLADRKGNSFLFSIASSFLITCFLLLSIFTGVSPLWISLFLIFGNTGQAFAQIAISNSISRSLSKEQVGVGMGVFSMTSFIAQGIAAGLYGSLAAFHTSIRWNPLLSNSVTYLFSNIYIVLVALHVGILVFYRLGIGKRSSSVAINQIGNFKEMGQ